MTSEMTDAGCRMTDAKEPGGNVLKSIHSPVRPIRHKSSAIRHPPFSFPDSLHEGLSTLQTDKPCDFIDQ